MALPDGPNRRWSLDFVADALSWGRRFRVLCIVDDFTREALALVVDTSIGFLPPTPPNSGSPPTRTLPAGQEIAVCDAHLILREPPVTSETDKARQFLQMLGAAYPALTKPQPVYRDWVNRAERTLKDLETVPEAHAKFYGRLYIRPYTDAEYPDAMVQMAALTALHEFGAWRGEPVPLEADLAKGMAKFYDPELKTLRRYLPKVGDDKNADAVDSW